MRKRLLWYILTALWCAVIFYQSGKNAESSDANSLYLVDLINTMLITIFGQQAGLITNFIVRKSAHFIEYMILGMLFFNSSFTGIKLRQVLAVSFIFGVGYSITDEIHQIFVPGRTAKITDICIDSSGIATGLIFIALCVLWRRSHHTA